MNKLIAIFLFTFIIPSEWFHINSINQLKEKSVYFAQNQKYEKSIETSLLLINQYHQNDPTIILNIANSYFKLGNFSKAEYYYKQIIESYREYHKEAYHQLGIIAFYNQKIDLAIKFTQIALTINSDTNASRLNLELYLRIKNRSNNNKVPNQQSTEEEKEQTTIQQQKQRSRKEKNDLGEEFQKNNNHLDKKENGNQELEEVIKKRLENINLNYKQALLILHQINQQENQYYYQQEFIYEGKESTIKE